MAEGSKAGSSSSSMPPPSNTPEKVKEDLQKKLVTFISSHLSDLNKVHAQLSKDRGTPECESVLNFLLKASVLKLFDVSEVKPPNSSHAFFLWLLLHLLRLMGSSKCRGLHPLAIQCVTGLYQGCSHKDLALFSFIVTQASDLLKCLASLTVHGADAFPGDSRLVALKHFAYGLPSKDKEAPLPPSPPIQLTSLHDCAYFTVALLSVLSEQSSKVNLYVSSVEPEVLRSLASLLKHGGACVKKAVVQALRQFLVDGWLVEGPVLDAQVSSVVAVAELAARMGSKDAKGVLKAMEGEVVGFLRWFFLSPLALPHHWSRLSSYLHTLVAAQAHRGMDCPAKHSVGTLLDLYVSRFASECSKAEFGRTAIEVLGRANQLQLVVSPLVRLCAGEEADLSQSTEGAKPAADSSTDSESALKPAKKLKTEKGKEKRGSLMPPPTVPSPSVHLLSQQALSLSAVLLQTLQQKGEGEGTAPQVRSDCDWTQVVCMLEGIRVALETNAHIDIGCQATAPPPEMWWTSRQLNSLTAAWEWAAAAAILSPSGSVTAEVLCKVYQSIGALYAIKLRDPEGLFSLLVDCLSFLLVLSWPKTLDKPWSALVGRSQLPPEVRASMVERLRTRPLDLGACQEETLLCMAAQPDAGFCLQMTAILKEALFSGESDRLKMAAVKCLPCWLACDETFPATFVQWTRDLLEGFPQMSCDVAEALCQSMCACLSTFAPPPGMTRVLTKGEWSSLAHHCLELRPRPPQPRPRLQGVFPASEGPGGGDVVRGWILEVAILALPHPSPRVATALLGSVEGLLAGMAEDAPALRGQLLKLLNSPSVEVLDAMRKNILHLFQRESSEEVASVVVALEEAYNGHLALNNPRARKGVLYCLEKVGLHVHRSDLSLVAMAMIKTFDDPSNSVRVAAAPLINNVIFQQGFSSMQLFDLVRVDLAQYLAEIIHADPEKVLRLENPLIQEVLELFSFAKSLAAILQPCLTALYPRLVYLTIFQPSQGLKAIATAIDKNMKELLVLTLKSIFAYLVHTCSAQEFDRGVVFLEDQLGVPMTSVLQLEPNSVLNELCVHLSLAPQRVRACMLRVVRACRGAQEGTPPDQQIKQFMEPLFLGVLAVLTTHFLPACKQKNRKKITTVVDSLAMLLGMMGPENVTPLRVTVLGMLRLAIQQPTAAVVRSGLRAWDTFVRNLKMDTLGSLLSQIVVTLSPLVEAHSAQVEGILAFLIVEHRDQLSGHFGEVHSLPAHPALQRVRGVFSEATSAQQLLVGLPEQVTRLLRGVVDEQAAVRAHALEHLAPLIRRHGNALKQLVTSRDSVDPVMAELFSTLMRVSRDSDPEVTVKAGVCLGELGAIDPGKLRLSLKTEDRRPIKVFEVDGSDGEFAVDLLAELIHSFLSATNTRAQDCCAFAMQEALKEYGCPGDAPASKGAVVWNKLCEDNRAILRPFLASKYLSQREASGPCPMPVHSAGRPFLFQEWIRMLTVTLMARVQQEHVYRVFKCSVHIFRHRVEVVAFLFPHVLCAALQQERSPTATEQLDTVQDLLQEIGHLASDLCSTSEAGGRGQLLAELTHGCQAIFSALDHLQYWMDKNMAAVMPQKTSRSRPASSSSAVQVQLSARVQQVGAFLDQLPWKLLAGAARACQAHARALRYMECHLQRTPADRQEQQLQASIGFLQSVYASLEEPDGVAGLSALRHSEPPLEERVLELETTGLYSEAAAYYNRGAQTSKQLSYFQGLLRCNMQMGQLMSVVMHIQGLQELRPEWSSSLHPMQVEAAWKLAKWDDLQELLQDSDTSSSSWSVGLGRVLLAARQKDTKLFYEQLRQVRSDQMLPLSVASMEAGSYHRGYDSVVRLHMLQELEEGARVLLDVGGARGRGSRREERRQLMVDWDQRLNITRTSYRSREPILNLRRLLHSLADSEASHKDIGRLWLQSCGMARRAGLLETAGNSLRMAEVFSIPELFLEKAKLLYAKGDTHQALLDLQKSIKEQWPAEGGGESNPPKGSEVHARALLCVGRWMEQTANHDTHTILKQYKSVVTTCPQLESGHFHLAKYYERLMQLFDTSEVKKQAEFLPFVLKEYGDTLRHGNKFIYRSIPRLLTLWLDYGTNFPDGPPTAGGSHKAPERSSLYGALVSLNSIVEDLSQALPPYHFLIAFSQLISRICHPNTAVFGHIQAIILKLIKHYPQQSLWMMMAVSKSAHKDRQTRCHRILAEAKKTSPGVEALIVDMMRLTDRLLDVSNKRVEGRSTSVVSLDKLCRGLTRLTGEGNFSPIIVPNQAALTVTLPLDGGSRYDNLDLFSGSQPTIVKFEDKVEVMTSLVRPKKMTILASDGQKYIMMCKPDDDLRKDCRLMEFYTLINKCLKKTPDSRQRNLYIRTYAVVPLNEKCGLIEWVCNTAGLRHIITKIYQDKGKYIPGPEIKELFRTKMTNNPLKLKENFEKYILPRFPPLFGLWFEQTFHDFTQWYSSRLAYSRTAAVMSMVGFVLGLGDRHGENILFDATNGDCIHVDFNCLFNRGKSLDVPEVVPFRLTHNMVKAMGVTGYEGVFRKSCEVTMQVLREQCEPLMCVLKTFIHDPLVELSKYKLVSETVEDKAKNIIKDIEDRINGKTGALRMMPPLSVAGQVHTLIQDAASTDNLSQMYVGWAAYL